MAKKDRIKKLVTVGTVIGSVYMVLRYVAKRETEKVNGDNSNPYLEKEICAENFYESSVKPMIDKLLSFLGLILLAPIYAVVSIAIYLDDPGPVFFTQKRIGKNKRYFQLHKFRSMKMQTPHDVPTHQLENPEQYITRIGKFLRKYSLDELPQIWDIFVGNMSIIGPRPALWNQEDLVAERDRYGANDVLPGLTGWAQIKGRDELEISDKAKLDGEYTAVLREGGIRAFWLDITCFFGTVTSVLHHDGVVEGGTGSFHKKNNSKEPCILVVSQYFYPETFRINDMAAEWVKRGYKVTVLTGIPNYPMGKFFEGYDYRHKRTEKWNGVEIIRIPLIPRGSSRIGMAANYISFVASGWWWQMTTDIHADLVFTFGLSPMTQALIGCWYGKKHHIPHFLYVQDLWPENVEAVTGIKNKMVIYPIDRMVDYIYKETDQIFATSPSFVDAVVNRKVGVNKSKVHYWPQYAEEFYKPLDRKAVRYKAEEDKNSPVHFIPDDESFKIAFTGNIGMAQGLDILPKTAEKLNAFCNKDIRFVIVGDGRYQETFEKELRDRGVSDRFIMIPRQPAESISDILACCDAAFLSFTDTKLWEMTIPAKLQSYMACGMPVIAAVKGETKRIIYEAQCGICCEIGDIEGLAKSIQELIDSDLKTMGHNSRKYYEKYYKRDRLMDEMDKWIGLK